MFAPTYPVCQGVYDLSAPSGDLGIVFTDDVLSRSLPSSESERLAGFRTRSNPSNVDLPEGRAEVCALLCGAAALVQHGDEAAALACARPSSGCGGGRLDTWDGGVADEDDWRWARISFRNRQLGVPYFHAPRPVQSLPTMNRTDIQSSIQSAAIRFVDETVAVFGEVFARVASDLAGKAPTRATAPAKKKAPTKKAALAQTKTPSTKPAPNAAMPDFNAASSKKPVPGKRIRRSGEQLLADAQRVAKLLAANRRGLRIEQINKQLGTATKQLARPILKLLSDRKIKKTGEKRATLYFPV
jgi:hypothetical protein